VTTGGTTTELAVDKVDVLVVEVAVEVWLVVEVVDALLAVEVVD